MAARIPERFISDLLARIDIVELIDGFVPLKKMGKDFKACCPFHEEKTPSFTVSQVKQFYHCFGCGAHGTAIGFLLEYERMGFREAVEELAKRAGMTIPVEAQEPAPAVNDSLPKLLDVLEKANKYYQRQLREHPQAQLAVDYLKNRGLTGEIAARFGLGFAPDAWDGLLRAVGTDSGQQQALFQAGLVIKKDTGGYYDRFRARVMFPIHDYRGRIVGFGGRIIAAGEPKYLNSPETPLFHKGRELYGLFGARDAIKREQRVLVVEGYMDVVALAQFDIDYAVAALGTATTRDHVERLFRHAPEVVFCFDGDRAGREAAWRALENVLPSLHDGRQVSFLFLPDGEDPDSLVRKEGAAAFGARVRAAQSLPDYVFQTLCARVDLGRLDGRARLIEIAKPLFKDLAPGAFTSLMVSRLAELSRMDRAEVERLLTGKPPPAKTTNGRGGRGVTRRSLVSSAVGLLLQHPELVRHVPLLVPLRTLDVPGIPLFLTLCELLQQEPNLTTGAILERFKDSDHSQSLAKLATWDYPDLIPDVTREFIELIDRLLKLALTHAIETVSNKLRATGLTNGERGALQQELRELLAKKQNWTLPQK